MKCVGIVTGASGGLGKAFAYELASEVEELWLIARRKKRLEDLSKQLSVPTKIIQLDLSKREEKKKFENILKKERPQIKYLVNNAGIGQVGSFSNIAFEDHEKTVELNILALVWLTHVTLPYMIRGSYILQIGSVLSFLPRPGFAVYAATKSFVSSFAQSLSVELKDRGIVVTAVCPGPIKTEFFKGDDMSGASPIKVARKAIRDAYKRKLVSIYSIKMWIIVFLSRFIPNKLLVKLMKRE